jgi:hypothetical protein
VVCNMVEFIANGSETRTNCLHHFSLSTCLKAHTPRIYTLTHTFDCTINRPGGSAGVAHNLEVHGGSGHEVAEVRQTEAHRIPQLVAELSTHTQNTHYTHTHSRTHSHMLTYLYPTTRLMSRLMSRPCEVYASRPNRKASAPHSGIPSGKSKR